MRRALRRNDDEADTLSVECKYASLTAQAQSFTDGARMDFGSCGSPLLTDTVGGSFVEEDSHVSE